MNVLTMIGYILRIRYFILLTNTLLKMIQVYRDSVSVNMRFFSSKYYRNLAS